MTDRYLSPAMVCELLPGITEDILSARRKRRLDPPFYKPTGQHGAVVLYLETDVLDWVAASKIQTRQV